MIASSSSSRSWLITEDAPPVGAEELHQPRAGIDVEVVRRFVERAHIASLEIRGKLDAAPLSPPDSAVRALDAVAFTNTKTGDE